MSNSTISFVHAKKRTRGELRLPQLHFIVCDDWINKIGEKAFAAWLKFYSWADRSDPERDFEKIPGSLNKVAEKLGVSKPTFYDKIIRPLWEYGFIELLEHEQNKTKCLNIVVYEYPQNDPSRSTTPLEKIRDYDKDYHSKSREKGKNGGLKKAQLRKQQNDDGVVKKFYQGEGGKKIEPPLVKNFYQGGKNFLPNNDPNISNGSNNYNDLKIDQSVENTSEVKSDESIIQQLIQSDDRLTDKRNEILKVYSLVKNEPGFTDAIFAFTLRKVINARIQQTSFENYFIRSLLNNIQEFTSQMKQKNNSPLPKSVMAAMEETAVAASDDALSQWPDEKYLEMQKRHIELLYSLGELSQEEYLSELARIASTSPQEPVASPDDTTIMQTGADGR